MTSAAGLGRLERLRNSLETLHRRTDFAERIEHDPIAVPRRFSDPLDIEIAGWLASALAYGRVGLFRKALDRILAVMDNRPKDYLRSFRPERDVQAFSHLYYRMNTGTDVACLLFLMQQVIERHGSAGALFTSLVRPEDESVGPALDRFIEFIRQIDTTPVYGRHLHPFGLTQLLSQPSKGSACKRMNLFLRWMIRPADGLDFGLWKGVPPSKLIIPLDTHILRICRYLGLTRRRSAGWTTARDVTDALRRVDPADPLRFDFPICHLGISGACPIGRSPELCAACALLPVCLKGRRLVAIQPH